MEVKEEKIKEIIVHVSNKMDLKDLVLTKIRPDGRPIMLYWCDGIAYTAYVIDDKTRDEEMLKGKYHFSFVYFAEMPVFKPMIEITTEQFGGLKIPIIDTSKMSIDKALISFLKRK